MTIQLKGWCIGWFLLLMLISSSATATPVTVWSGVVHSLNNGNAESGCGNHPIARDALGNLYVTGSASNGSNADLLTYKVNGATGTTMWSKSYNGTGNDIDRGCATAIDPAGNVVVTGYSSDVSEYYNIRTIKYDGLTGTVIWSVSFNGSAASSSDIGVAIGTDGNGDVFVTGMSEEAGQRGNLRTIKYSGATGALLWSASFNGAEDDSDAAKSLLVMPSGDVLVAGVARDGPGGNSLRIIKYSGSTGAVIFSVSDAGGNWDVSATGMALDGDNNVVVCGSRFDLGEGLNIRTLKLAGTNGALQWSASYNGSANGSDFCSSVSLDSSGHVLVTGGSEDIAGTRSIRTIKYSGVTGALMWTAAFSGAAGGFDYAHAVAVDQSGNVYVTGRSVDILPFENIRTIKYEGLSGAQLWTVSYDGPAGFQDIGYSIVVDSDLVFVNGLSSDGVEGFGIRTLKYNAADGTLLWTSAEPAVLTVPQNDVQQSAKLLARDPAGNVAIVFSSLETGRKTDLRVLRFNGSSGAQTWSAAYNGGGNSFDSAAAIAMDANGDVFVVGTSIELGKL